MLLDHSWAKAEDDQPVRASQNTATVEGEGWVLCLVAPLSSAKELWCWEALGPRTWFCSCTFAGCVASELCESVSDPCCLSEVCSGNVAGMFSELAGPLAP